MQLYVDNQLVEDEEYQGGTLMDALRRVQANLCPPGHVVISIHCDGEPVPGNRMAQTLARKMSSFDRLEVVTGTMESLVLDALAEAEACLEATDANAAQVSQLLMAGKHVEGVALLGECLRTWQQIHGSIVQSLQCMTIAPEAFQVRNLPLDKALDRPREVLLQIKQALMAQDYVLLADILQYEFADVTALWQEMVEKAQQEARNRLLNPP